jgi:beta-galactosidase GanA
MKKLYTACFCLFVLLSAHAQSSKRAESADMPHLSKRGSATQLVVKGKPFLVLGGELGNSSASDMAYMRPAWPKLEQLHLNTVLAPVYWEMLEPEEGKFDFRLVDSLIQNARARNLKLVLLWFGSWKNSMSSYVPVWVETNQKKYPRAQDRNKIGQEILSPFSKNNLEADAKAFRALMRHIRETDQQEQTVVMVQVENEIGMLPDARDYSPAATEAFRKPVPKELMAYLQQHKDKLQPHVKNLWASSNFQKQGTWEEVFGKSLATDELFMAWYFGQYANQVTAAGKAEYPLPMFVNAALNRPFAARHGYMESGGPAD